MIDIENQITEEIYFFNLEKEETSIAINSSIESIEIEENPNYQESVTLNSVDKGVAESYKYAINFNLKNLFESVGTLMINLTSITISPWLGLIGFLIFLKQVKEVISVKLDRETCKVLWGICQIELKDEYPNKEMNLEDIISVTNLELTKYKKGELTKTQVIDSMNILGELDIIIKIGDDFYEVNTYIKVYKRKIDTDRVDGPPTNT